MSIRALKRGVSLRYVALISIAVLNGALTNANAAGVVADGSTATTVTTATGGRQTVSIAPATYGVSRNNYSDFNVGAPGVALNNSGINARTIVNQVTSTNPSLIAGDITVLGPRANVVLANPNGITVNGGSFINTGRVALTTGQVSFSDVTASDGSVVQRNIVLDTQSGTIVVGPQGLASALIGVDLIAKQILVQGALANTFSSSTADLRLIGGTSNVTLNTGLSPTDNANDWVSINAASSASRAAKDGFAIDITAAGSLSSGRIELIVTDQGPGVRSAGMMNAAYGGFTISSAGTVEMQGAATTAASAIRIAGAGVDLSTGTRGQTVIASSGSAVAINSTADITSTGALVQGNTADSTDGSSAGAVSLVATGNISNTSQAGSSLGILFGVAGDVVLKAGGNITNENARILSNTGVTLAASGDVNNLSDHSTGVNNGAPVDYASRSAGFLFLKNKQNGVDIDYGQLADATQLAYITAASGNVAISGANINNNGGSILADAGAIALAAGNAISTQAILTGQASFHQSCFIFCHSTASSNVQIYGGVIEASGDISLKAGQQIVNTGGTVLAFGHLALDAPRTIARAVTAYTAFNRTNDLKAWFGNAWSAIYAADTGGLFTGGSGQVTLTGSADIDGGSFNAPDGIAALGGVNTVRLPYRQPMTIGNHNHVGLVSWFGL